MAFKTRKRMNELNCLFYIFQTRLIPFFSLPEKSVSKFIIVVQLLNAAYMDPCEEVACSSKKERFEVPCLAQFRSWI